MKTTHTNIHPLERVGSVTLGGALLFRSVKHPSAGKAVLALDLLYQGLSGHSFLYQALGVSTTNGNKQQAGVLEVERTITIGKPANEIYQTWRSPQKLALIMGDIAEVKEESQERTHWKMRVWPGRCIEWDTSIQEDRPGEFLSWKSVESAQVPNEGSIRFRPAPGEKGTEVTLRFRFDLPAGVLGNIMATRLSFLPRMATKQILRRLKSLMEAGEIPTLAHNPSARPDLRQQAQPSPTDRTSAHMAVSAG